MPFHVIPDPLPEGDTTDYAEDKYWTVTDFEGSELFVDVVAEEEPSEEEPNGIYLSLKSSRFHTDRKTYTRTDGLFSFEEAKHIRDLLDLMLEVHAPDLIKTNNTEQKAV